MAEFNIGAFKMRLVELFLGSSLFPYMKGNYITKGGLVQDDKTKHPKRDPRHLKTVTRHCINETTVTSQDMITFDIGNEKMETIYPYYHILQDSPYIRKRDLGTDKTKGSQAKVETSKRDYGIVSWNGKTFSKEYARNVRGSRNRLDKISHWQTNANGTREFINRESNSYQNIHYKYIDRILDSGILKELASEFGMKNARKESTGLAEEWSLQSFEDTPTSLLQIFDSFE